MSEAKNKAIFDLLGSQDGTPLTNLYNALKFTDAASPPVESIRVFHQQVKSNIPKPYIVYERTNGDHARHLLGDSGLDQAEYNFEIYGKNTNDHGVIAELLRLAINALINKTVSSVNFRSIFIDDDVDSIIFPTNNSQKSSLSTSVSYKIVFSQPKANVT